MGIPDRERPATLGRARTDALPSTMKAAASAMARVPRPSAAAFGAAAASVIVPPFRASAEALTEIPFASASPAATVYSKTSEAVPLPEA